MTNMGHLIYTYQHRQAVLYVAQKLISSQKLTMMEITELLKRARYHDLDKAVLYTLIDKTTASRYHKLTAQHHLRPFNIYEGNHTYIDYLEAICDWDSAHYTKLDKPLNAYDQARVPGFMTEKTQNAFVDILRKFGMDHSYQVDPEEPGWKKFQATLPDPTEENIMAEIYDYLMTQDDNVLKQLQRENPGSITPIWAENTVHHLIEKLEKK
jgi:hypothetical protein